MKKYKLPTRKECFDMIKEYHVPSHILRHSRTVAKLAVFLAERLKEKGIAVDVNLVERACLLHDILRVCDFKELDYKKFKQTIGEEDKRKWEQIKEKYKGLCHEDAVYNLLKEKYQVLSLTIKRHKYIGMLDEKMRPNSWEEKLVFYADLRVMHEEIVPLEQRLKDGHQRNVHLHGTEAQGRINTAKLDRLICKLEEEIFEKVGLSPLEVTGGFIDTYLSKMERAD